MFDVLRKIYLLLSPQRRKQLLWLAVGMFFMSLMELGLAGAISLLGVALAAPDSLEKIGPLWKLFHMLPNLGEDIPQSIRMLIVVLGLVCVAAALKNIFLGLMSYWQVVLSQGVGWDISQLVFDNYLHAPYVWHTQHNPAELNGVLGWRVFIAYFISAALQAGTQLVIMFFLMAGAFILAPMVSTILYGVSACVSVVIYKAAQRKAHSVGEVAGRLNVEVGKVALSALYGIREVQIYGQQASFERSYAAYAGPASVATAKQLVFPFMPHWVLESLGMVLLFGAVMLMALRGDSVAGITGTLTLMAGISWRLLPALNKVVGGVLHLKAHLSPAQTLLADYITMPRIEARETRHGFSQTLELKDVSFQYPEGKSLALQHINLTLAKGTMVGLIGVSGAGKSTLVGVLTGLLPPTSGMVLVDGKKITPFPGFLKIGYVPQSPYIMDATLAENVAFCDWGQKPDEERVRHCCHMAAIDFIDDLSEGIHTILGERGLRLSGGQVQRVAIARALYNNPDILLFDEATSALDGAAEASIQGTILKLRRDMTIIIVAHRLSTIESCDVLYWVQEGTVKQHGANSSTLAEYEEFLRSGAQK